MKRLWLGLLVVGGCSTHSVEPRAPYDQPESIPVVTNVLAAPGPGGNFDLTWEYDDSIFAVVDGFYVERAPFDGTSPSGPFVRLNRELIQRREFEDRSFLPEGGYAYQVVSETGAGIDSRPSAWGLGYVDFHPPDPPELTVTLTVRSGRQTVDLAWNMPNEDVIFYRVYREPSFLFGAAFLEQTGQTFTDYDVVPVTVYHYWVTALDLGLNESVHSNVEGVQVDF